LPSFCGELHSLRSSGVLPASVGWTSKVRTAVTATVDVHPRERAFTALDGASMFQPQVQQRQCRYRKVEESRVQARARTRVQDRG
jgi:hypothetical protein